MDDQLILDRYRLIERLALGGSAEVWRARDEQLDREVAIKRLHPHLFADAASRSRLASEARAAARLRHPGIVGIYDVDATGEAPAIVMELVDGESLATRITRDGPLPEADAAAVVAEVADALFHAHQQGVIHRDVKPANILVARDGRVRLVDFGIAHSLADASARLTQAGTVIGTLSSMAPEQLADGPITPRTDLYGIGVVLHEALTGRSAFDSTSPVALADAQRTGPPPMEGVDPGLAAIVASCLAYEPERRPLHAGALAEALRAWVPGRGVAAAAALDTSGVTQPMPSVTAPPTVVPAAAPPVAAPRRRPQASPSPAPRRLPAAVAALLGLAILGGLAALVANRPSAVADVPSSGSAAPSVAAPTPEPEWLAKLVEDVEKACGPETAAEAEPILASMSEEEAKEEARGLVEACKDADDDDEGGGNGRGRGGGNENGNGNGRGGDD